MREKILEEVINYLGSSMCFDTSDLHGGGTTRWRSHRLVTKCYGVVSGLSLSVTGLLRVFRGITGLLLVTGCLVTLIKN